MSAGYHILQNQLCQVREYVEEFWTIHTDPRDGERKKYIEQGALLDMLDTFGVD